MRRNQISGLWLVLLTCLLVILCPTALRLTNAQTDRQTEGTLPGVPAGYTIIDGDIQMPISVVNALRQQAQRAPHAPQAAFTTELWPNGVIPFQFETTCAATSACTGAPPSGCVSAARQNLMLSAMAVLEGVANVDFQQCGNNTCNGDFVRIRDSSNDTDVGQNNTCKNVSRNSSAVGVQGGRQTINIVSWNTQFIIVHELLHCLGFFHEQSRADRNNYVQVNCNNVQSGCNGDTFTVNFTVKDEATTYGNYDFDSVMHYGQCAFSVNNNCPTVSQAFPDGGLTVTVLAPYTAQWQSAIGQRDYLSALDEATLSFLYPYSNWRFLDCDYDGDNGASNGTFRRPYTSFTTAFNNTPAGGTLWILRSCNFTAVGVYNKQIKIRAAPGVTATLAD
jgi:hypothetical protein